MLFLYGAYEEENSFIFIVFSFIPRSEIGHPRKNYSKSPPKGFMRKSILLVLIILLAFPCVIFAETDMDLRFKLGSAAGADRIASDYTTIGHGPDHFGTNVQVEVVLNEHPKWDTTARFIMALGLFYRQHPGEIKDLSIPIKVGYSAYGVSIAPGLRLRINDAWSLEGKVELGIGDGAKLTLDSPGVNRYATKTGDYKSVSPIIGCYYLFEDSTSRVGFEVGEQKFWGDFEIWSNSGRWTDGDLSGRYETFNIIYGIQF